MSEEANLFKQQTEMLHQNIHVLDEKNKTWHSLAHDLRNYLQISNILSKNNEDQYTKNLNNKIQALTQKHYCNNKILDAILNNSMIQAYETNIKMTIELDYVDWNFMNSFDITTIFSNLLNNALEACEESNLDNNFIQLLCFKRNSHIILHLDNSYDKKQVKKNNDLFVSTKKGHTGIGLNNVIKTLEKYDGNLRFELSKDIFSVQIIIGIPK